MTETLTEEERARLARMYQTPLGRKALRIIDRDAATLARVRALYDARDRYERDELCEAWGEALAGAGAPELEAAPTPVPVVALALHEQRLAAANAALARVRDAVKRAGRMWPPGEQPGLDRCVELVTKAIAGVGAPEVDVLGQKLMNPPVTVNEWVGVMSDNEQAKQWKRDLAAANARVAELETQARAAAHEAGEALAEAYERAEAALTRANYAESEAAPLRQYIQTQDAVMRARVGELEAEAAALRAVVGRPN